MTMRIFFLLAPPIIAVLAFIINALKTGFVDECKSIGFENPILTSSLVSLIFMGSIMYMWASLTFTRFGHEMGVGLFFGSLAVMFFAKLSGSDNLSSTQFIFIMGALVAAGILLIMRLAMSIAGTGVAGAATIPAIPTAPTQPIKWWIPFVILGVVVSVILIGINWDSIKSVGKNSLSNTPTIQQPAAVTPTTPAYTIPK